MKSFTAVAAVCALLVLAGVSVVRAQNTLPPVNVTANPCDYGISCKFDMGMSSFLVPMTPAIPPAVDSISPDGYELIATCASMRLSSAFIRDCDVNSPPPVPGFPSPTLGTWFPNGCGDGTWKSEIGRHVLGIADLDMPLPGISFQPACNHHDSCYHTGFKKFCDMRFAGELANICGSSTPCIDKAFLYSEAVDHFGQGAYDKDQRNMECAKIADALKNGECIG